MSVLAPIPESDGRRSLPALYFQVAFFQSALLLGIHAGTYFLLPGDKTVNALLALAIEGSIALVAVLGMEMARTTGGLHAEPRGILFSLIGLLQVVLCLATGGLSSPYYLLVATTGVFAGLTMRPLRATLVTALLASSYVVASLTVVADSSAVQGTEAITAISFHVGFLFFATILSSRIGSRHRKTMTSLENQSKRDPLTSLENRRGFLEKMQNELSRAERFAWPISMLVVDLDHFKRLNDEHGHAVGDLVLVETAALLRETVGTIDHLARVGGEEFAVAAVAAEPQHGKDLADRIVRAFRMCNWSRVRPGMKVTVSVGVAVLHPGQHTLPVSVVLSDLMERADRALYHVKENGRDGFHVATPAEETAAKA